MAHCSATSCCAAPETNGETGEVGGTKSGGLSDFRALNSDTEDIGLELHEQVVDNSTAVNAQGLQTHAAIGFHCLKYIAGLVAHGLQCCTSDMTDGRATSEANDGATCIGVPVRSAKTDEGRDEIDAAIVGNRSRQCLYINAVLNDLQAITQPLDGSAGNEDTAFQCIGQLGIVGLALAPGNGGKQTVLRRNALVAGVHQHETAGAIGVLRHTNFEAGLAEGGGLLVASVTRHFDGCAKELRGGLAEDAAGWHNGGQHRVGNTQFIENDIIPFALVDVEHEGT